MATILSIDDDPVLQDLVGQVLGGHGHDVHWAFNGEEGFEKAQILRPQLIILDMILPTLSGVEVLKLFKAHETLKAVPVIVVTGYVGEPPFTAAAVKALGAREFVPKPVQFDALAALIEATLKAVPPAEPS
ncbi:MAG: response regulator [Elusimicrobiota bacterium]